MEPFPWLYLVALALLILLNGIFAMSELAIVSARTARLRMAAEKGSKSAAVAMRLAAEPGKFLSTVQIGITLIAVISGAVSGATLGEPVGQRLALLGIDPDLATEMGFVLVIALTTFFSVVVGELVPKQLALRAAVPISLAMAIPMSVLAKVAAPFVWLLDTTSNLLLALLGIRHKGDHRMTAEELQMIFADATRTGVIEEQERAILSGIMRLQDRPVRELMTPRTELDWLDIDADEDAIRQTISDSPHSLLPVAEGNPDKVLGVVKVREVLTLLMAGRPVVLNELLRKSEVVPDQLDAMDALRVLQQSGTGMAMVHDEYGHLDGVVTTADLLSAIAGDFASHQDEGDTPMIAERDDGSLLISGALAADALADRLGLDLPDNREFATAAGYALFVLKHLPAEGESFTDQGWRFEVVDMDGRKIDKLLVASLD
ncbi:hemolysin family protein [Aurantiacibacter gangjinensis]|uniref:DNA-binding protein n=1 Tax=Aurantiacibacter gangjinensis TaxID=502682 RepID=A0A0G9MQU0_9SPHN|nr:hemolysin family protein [Aurantiacibacter gangjinensis]APE27586.1 Magnesium and cobalt efflux protein CorC [Aurantiacibacter gangjinensis]KLE31623.1 DNA-binding protein [Aurantiacibacter gangjinensis]